MIQFYSVPVCKICKMYRLFLLIKHYILKALAVLNIKSFCAYLCTLTRTRFLLDYFEMVYFMKPYVHNNVWDHFWKKRLKDCSHPFISKLSKDIWTYVFNHSLKYISISPLYLLTRSLRFYILLLVIMRLLEAELHPLAIRGSIYFVLIPKGVLLDSLEAVVCWKEILKCQATLQSM